MKIELRDNQIEPALRVYDQAAARKKRRQARQAPTKPRRALGRSQNGEESPATGEPIHRAAVALAQTTGFSPEERQIILRLVLGKGRGGREVAELHAAVLARLGAREFSWPEFDRWQTFFTERSRFPALWEDLKTIPPREATLRVRHAYQERKLYLLLDWLMGLAARLAETRITLARYEKQSVRAEITRQTPGTSCAICELLNHREVKHNSSNVPPFHPGCRCVILAMPAGAG